LGPITAARMYLTSWTQMAIAIAEAQHRSDALRIARRPMQLDSKTGLGSSVVEEQRGMAILRKGQIRPAIMIVIADRQAPAFPIDGQAVFRARHGHKSATSVAAQPKASSGVEPGCLRGDFEEILAPHEVFIPVPI